MGTKEVLSQLKSGHSVFNCFLHLLLVTSMDFVRNTMIAVEILMIRIEVERRTMSVLQLIAHGATVKSKTKT